MTKEDTLQLNPLVLAFVGDGVFTLFIRKKLAEKSDAKAGKLHKKANEYVKASAQAKILDGIISKFDEVEQNLARRARNCHNNTKAKNASLTDYKKATELEAVFGYLYLSNNHERLDYLLNESFNFNIQGEA